MSTPSPHWIFAHRALSPQFHEDPARFVATLDGNAAPGYLEHMWRWALSAAGQDRPATPPLTYAIDRPRAGLAIVWMQLSGVTRTGEPWQIAFIVRSPDAGQANGYTRMFLLEHDEYASELERRPCAIPCESAADGSHLNLGMTLAPDDRDGFYRVILDALRRSAS